VASILRRQFFSFSHSPKRLALELRPPASGTAALPSFRPSWSEISSDGASAGQQRRDRHEAQPSDRPVHRPGWSRAPGCVAGSCRRTPGRPWSIAGRTESARLRKLGKLGQVAQLTIAGKKRPQELACPPIRAFAGWRTRGARQFATPLHLTTCDLSCPAVPKISSADAQNPCEPGNSCYASPTWNEEDCVDCSGPAEIAGRTCGSSTVPPVACCFDKTDSRSLFHFLGPILFDSLSRSAKAASTSIDERHPGFRQRDVDVQLVERLA